MSTPPNIPNGFIKKPRPKSVAEAVSQNSHDRLKTVVKSALAGYIGSFLDTTGVHRSFVNATSPAGLVFVTDKSLQDSQDPQYKPTQLARYYNEIRQKLPSILIIDSGFKWTPSGLGGGLHAATNINNKWQGYYKITGTVPITVSVITGDQETTDMLLNVLMLLFDPLRNVAGGSRICSKSSTDFWEVRLPLSFTVGGTSAQEYEGDPIGRFWVANIEMEVDVEDQIAIEMDMLKADVVGGVINYAVFEKFGKPSISAPAQVSVKDGPFIVSIPNYNPLSHRVIINNPDVATLELGSLIYVTPHKIGNFSIKVVSNRMAGTEDNPLAPISAEELAVANISVVY